MSTQIHKKTYSPQDELEAAELLGTFRTSRASSTDSSKSLNARCLPYSASCLKVEDDEDDLSTTLLSLKPLNRNKFKLNSSRWSPKDDERLRALVSRFGDKAWHLVAEHMGEDDGGQPPTSASSSSAAEAAAASLRPSHHTAIQCMCRWKNVLSPEVRKGPWTEEEDEIVRELVAAADGPDKIKWREVAEHLSGRLGKQCRERWFNQLDPAINTGPWTPDEDQRLLEAQRKFGNRWIKIAKELDGRTENAVKNRYNSVSFKRWKDAVEGCLGLTTTTTTITSSPPTPNSSSENAANAISGVGCAARAAAATPSSSSSVLSASSAAKRCKVAAAAAGVGGEAEASSSESVPWGQGVGGEAPEPLPSPSSSSSSCQLNCSPSLPCPPSSSSHSSNSSSSSSSSSLSLPPLSLAACPTNRSSRSPSPQCHRGGDGSSSTTASTSSRSSSSGREDEDDDAALECEPDKRADFLANSECRGSETSRHRAPFKLSIAPPVSAPSAAAAAAAAVAAAAVAAATAVGGAATAAVAEEAAATGGARVEIQAPKKRPRGDSPKTTTQTVPLPELVDPSSFMADSSASTAKSGTQQEGQGYAAAAVEEEAGAATTGQRSPVDVLRHQLALVVTQRRDLDAKEHHLRAAIQGLEMQQQQQQQQLQQHEQQQVPASLQGPPVGC